MKKLLCLFAVIALTAPAFADVEIICTDNGGGSVTVSYVADTEAELVRAFALDISVDAGTITGISNFKTGESTQADPGYGIFMTSIDLTDPENPVWNTPVADPVDPEDNPYTCGGLGDSCITVELGSLYDMAVPNDSPLTSGDLFDLTVSETCNMSIDINADIGGIVMEGDPPAAPATIISTGCSITVGPGECYVLGAQRGTCTNYNYGNQLITQAQVDAWNAAGQPDAWCCPCQPCGDADNSGGVTAGDYFAIFSALGNPASLNPQEDVDHSGSVTAGDYFIVFENLGLSCGAVCPPL
jgi:hypothetical protein